jgi:hypothetical protein
MAISWCSCFAQITSPTPPCTSSGTCVFAPNMLVKGTSSVYPCGATEINGTISIIDKVVLSTNGATAIYKIESNSVNLQTLTINANEITFQANYDPAVTGSSYLTAQIEYSVTQGGLKDYGTIDIIFRSRCTDVNCSDTQECDPCLGTCVDKAVDISITSGGEDPTDINIS